jgi:cell division protein FtsB
MVSAHVSTLPNVPDWGLAMTVADLVIDALVQSEWQLAERCAALQASNDALVALVADLAMDRALFERLARAWLQQTAEARQTASALRDEIRRYVAARV